MKTMFITIAALTAVAVAAPAAAQNRGGYGDVRVEHLQDQLQQGVQRGTISRQEAMPLRERLRQLTRLERQYSRDGLNRRERHDLQQRIQTLRQQIRFAASNGGRDGRGRGGHDGHDDDRDGRHGRDGRGGR
jgi:hypothetical protein